MLLLEYTLLLQHMHLMLYDSYKASSFLLPVRVKKVVPNFLQIKGNAFNRSLFDSGLKRKIVVSSSGSRDLHPLRGAVHGHQGAHQAARKEALSGEEGSFVILLSTVNNKTSA